MRDIRGKSAVVIGVLYVAFVAWSLYGALFPVEMHTRCRELCRLVLGRG